MVMSHNYRAHSDPGLVAGLVAEVTRLVGVLSALVPACGSECLVFRDDLGFDGFSIPSLCRTIALIRSSSSSMAPQLVADSRINAL